MHAPKDAIRPIFLIISKLRFNKTVIHIIYIILHTVWGVTTLYILYN